MIPYGIKVGHEYHIIEFHNKLPPPEMFDWLQKSFGEHGDRWIYKFPKMYFADARDHLIFTLKWA